MYTCGVNNCTQEALEPRESCIAHTCKILHCRRRIKKNYLCRSHLCDRCGIREKIRENGCKVCTCKYKYCSRKPLGGESCERHICRFCNESRYKSARTCKVHLCGRRKCNSPPKLTTNKDNKYVVAMLKSTVFSLDIIFNIIVPYAGITDGMCPYHLRLITR